VSGIVLNAQTHEPISSAEVAVSSARYTFTNTPETMEGWQKIPSADLPEYNRTHLVAPSLSNALAAVRAPVVLTEADGHFTISRDRRWIIYAVPGDHFQPCGTLVVRRDGYEPLLREFWSWDSTNLGDVFLKPVTK
jgi:hypothetical protein